MLSKGVSPVYDEYGYLAGTQYDEYGTPLVDENGNPQGTVYDEAGLPEFDDTGHVLVYGQRYDENGWPVGTQYDEAGNPLLDEWGQPAGHPVRRVRQLRVRRAGQPGDQLMSTRAIRPKVSVIMPVFRVEAYVGRAIESILNQTLDDFEFLIVDDGSPDRSGEICDEYARRDQRIQVFHRENSGAPAARNFAMDQARGEYLYFLDADDWAEPTMLQDMYELGREGGLQLVIAGFYIDTYSTRDSEDFLRQKLSVASQVFSSQREFREQAWRLFEVNQLYNALEQAVRARLHRAQRAALPADVLGRLPLRPVGDPRHRARGRDRARVLPLHPRAPGQRDLALPARGCTRSAEEEHRWMLDLYRHWGVDDPASMEVVYRRYAERLVGCIENVTCKDSGLTRRQMRQRVREIIGTPQAIEAARGVAPAEPRHGGDAVAHPRAAPVARLHGGARHLVREGQLLAALRQAQGPALRRGQGRRAGVVAFVSRVIS